MNDAFITDLIAHLLRTDGTRRRVYRDGEILDLIPILLLSAPSTRDTTHLLSAWAVRRGLRPDASDVEVRLFVDEWFDRHPIDHRLMQDVQRFLDDALPPFAFDDETDLPATRRVEKPTRYGTPVFEARVQLVVAP